VGISLVERVPPQCFRCLARGHIGRWCPSAVDQGRCCLRCGRRGHKIGQCRVERPHCPICEERGLRAEHGPGDPSQCRVVPPGPLRSPPPDPERGRLGRKREGRMVLRSREISPGTRGPWLVPPGIPRGKAGGNRGQRRMSPGRGFRTRGRRPWPSRRGSLPPRVRRARPGARVPPPPPPICRWSGRRDPREGQSARARRLELVASSWPSSLTRRKDWGGARKAK